MEDIVDLEVELRDVEKVAVYDCEILNCISKKDEEHNPDYKYCEGWNDFAGMGISCVGVWTSWDDRYRVFDGHPRIETAHTGQDSELQQIFNKDCLFVGFNNINFDNNLLRANGFEIDDSKCFDLLRYVWNADGLGDEFNAKTHSNYGLDALAKANGLEGKSGYGGNAPKQWQDGRYCDVIDYCLNDVKITRALYYKLVDSWSHLTHPFKPNMEIRYKK